MTVPILNYTITNGTITSPTPHGLSSYVQLAVESVTGNVANVIIGGVYWVVNELTSNVQFQLSEKRHGFAANITGTGNISLFHGSTPAVDPLGPGLYSSIQPEALFVKQYPGFVPLYSGGRSLQRHEMMYCSVGSNTFLTFPKVSTLVEGTPTSIMSNMTLFYATNITSNVESTTFQLSLTPGGNVEVFSSNANVALISPVASNVADIVPTWPDWMESQWPNKVPKVHYDQNHFHSRFDDDGLGEINSPTVSSVIICSSGHNFTIGNVTFGGNNVICGKGFDSQSFDSYEIG